MSMKDNEKTGFEAFKERFESEFESIYEFIEDTENYHPKNPLNAVLIQNGDVIAHDSYGSEDSKLNRVFQFSDFGDIYVMFSGNRCSYQGEEWDEYKEVKPTTIEIVKYE